MDFGKPNVEFKDLQQPIKEQDIDRISSEEKKQQKLTPNFWSMVEKKEKV